MRTRMRNSCPCIRAQSSRMPSQHDINAGPVKRTHRTHQPRHGRFSEAPLYRLKQRPCTLRNNQSLPATRRATASMVKPREDPTLQHALSLFQDAFGSEPDIAAFAPGRVNLIGASMGGGREEEMEEMRGGGRGCGGKSIVLPFRPSKTPPSLSPLFPP